MEWIEVSAKIEGQIVNKFIHDYFLNEFSSHLENLDEATISS